jgi:hypothetical protein
MEAMAVDSYGECFNNKQVQHTSAYVSIRQHTSAYVSIRQHMMAVDSYGECFNNTQV